MNHFRVRYTVTYEYDVVAPTVADAAFKARCTLAGSPGHKHILAVFPAEEMPPDTSFASWYMKAKRRHDRK